MKKLTNWQIIRMMWRKNEWYQIDHESYFSNGLIIMCVHGIEARHKDCWITGNFLKPEFLLWQSCFPVFVITQFLIWRIVRHVKRNDDLMIPCESCHKLFEPHSGSFIEASIEVNEEGLISPREVVRWPRSLDDIAIAQLFSAEPGDYITVGAVAVCDACMNKPVRAHKYL